MLKIWSIIKTNKENKIDNKNYYNLNLSIPHMKLMIKKEQTKVCAFKSNQTQINKPILINYLFVLLLLL